MRRATLVIRSPHWRTFMGHKGNCNDPQPGSVADFTGTPPNTDSDRAADY